MSTTMFSDLINVDANSIKNKITNDNTDSIFLSFTIYNKKVT